MMRLKSISLHNKIKSVYKTARNRRPSIVDAEVAVYFLKHLKRSQNLITIIKEIILVVVKY